MPVLLEIIISLFCKEIKAHEILLYSILSALIAFTLILGDTDLYEPLNIFVCCFVMKPQRLL